MREGNTFGFDAAHIPAIVGSFWSGAVAGNRAVAGAAFALEIAPRDGSPATVAKSTECRHPAEFAAQLQCHSEFERACGGRPGLQFVNVAREAGLHAKTIFGGEHKNKYLLETTGCGVAFFDYDNDGWLDIFLVNGTRFEGFPAGQAPTSATCTRTIATARSPMSRSKPASRIPAGARAVCVGDYDNDGYDDLFVTYWGKNVLYHNNGNGTFTDVS